MIAIIADCSSGDCHILTLLQSSRSFCRNLPLFVVSLPTIQWITRLVMLANKIRRVSRIMITRQELIRGTMPCRGARNAHGSFSIRSPPSKFYLQVIATEIGRKSTSRHKSQIRISGLWPQRIYITSRNVRVLMRDATADQRLSQRAAFDSCWCCTKKRWTINHGWLQRTQIQTTISEKYS